MKEIKKKIKANKEISQRHNPFVISKTGTSGITLIALVITIIVLLILAGVSIATLTGDNGILNQAQRAKEETEIATDEEQRKIAMAEATMNFEETEYQGIKIPAGMAPTRIKGESTIKEGLVAIDKNGNEWVWIEVPKPTIKEKTEGLNFEDEDDYTMLTAALKQYSSPYGNGAVKVVSGEWADEWYDGCGLGKEEYEETYQKMLKSVYENEGFWIGRYEAGIEGSTGTDKASLALGRTVENKETANEKAICQKDAIPYDCVTVKQAQELANQMTPDKTKISSLMFGIQWNLVCKYLVVNSDLVQDDINKDSGKWGNYKNQTVEINSKNTKQLKITNTESGELVLGQWKSSTDVKQANETVLLSTGASNKTKKLNIYDLAGNVYEWVLENLKKSPEGFVCRGSSGGDPSDASASFKHAPKDVKGYVSQGVGFRPALY